MKLFGKKTLAMIMAIAMVLSVCSVSAFAEGETPTDPPASVAVTGVTLDKDSVADLWVKKTASLTATVAPENATNKAVAWSSSDETVATVSNSGVVTAKKAGETTITVTTADGSFTDTCTVKVEKAPITGAGTQVSPVPYGATEAVVRAKLTKEVDVTLGQNQEWVQLPINSEFAGDWVGTYSATAEKHVYEAAFKENDVYSIADGVKLKLTIPTSKTWSLSDISITAVYDGDDDVYINLGNKVYSAITTALGKEPTDRIYFDFEDVSYGEVDHYGYDYTVTLDDDDEEKLYEDGELYDSFTYETTVDGVKYSGTVKLTLCTTDVSETFTYAGGSLSAIASKIDALLGGKMEAIEFEELDLEGGVLWADDKYEEEVYEDEYYTPTELADMIYLPNGSGETSYLSYVAYDDYDADEGEVDEDADYIEGTIRLYADEFLLLSANITSEEVVELEGSVFEEAFLDLDSDYEYLDYVTFTKPASSDGYLYVEYDEDDNKHTSIGSSTKYYVEDDDKALIDEITYVPGKNTEGVVNIKFKAIGYDDDEKKVTVNGIMQITVTVAADITIQAGKEQTVEIDPDLFLEYIEDVDTSNKDLEIVSVAITGAPYQAKKGYLVTDGDELTKSGVKTFYADEDDVDVDKKKYDLFDLYFLGGEKDGIVEATFKVTYLREGSTTKRYAEGTIDFVTGAVSATNSLTGSTMASQVFSFDNKGTLDAFAALGGNDNEYIVFTSLPVGGKLVYNWGTNSQQDVTVGTAYYVDGYGSQKQLKNVTFVPSYSASKIEKTVTMNIKGYNEKDKAVNGTITITVKHATTSSKFYDITNSTYADSVDFLANEGITTGMSATTFGPNNNVNRAQFVTFLWRAAGSPSVYGVTNKFTDVKSTGEHAYAYQAILWAVQNGITTGRTATSFAPGANVTHQELLTFLYRYDVNYLKHSGTTSSYVNYSDYSSVDPYAQVPVKWADYKGILTGYAIQPKVAGTRATVALWLHRMLTL